MNIRMILALVFFINFAIIAVIRIDIDFSWAFPLELFFLIMMAIFFMIGIPLPYYEKDYGFKFDYSNHKIINLIDGNDSEKDFLDLLHYYMKIWYRKINENNFSKIEKLFQFLTEDNNQNILLDDNGNHYILSDKFLYDNYLLKKIVFNQKNFSVKKYYETKNDQIIFYLEENLSYAIFYRMLEKYQDTNIKREKIFNEVDEIEFVLN